MSLASVGKSIAEVATDIEHYLSGTHSVEIDRKVRVTFLWSIILLNQPIPKVNGIKAEIQRNNETIQALLGDLQAIEVENQIVVQDLERRIKEAVGNQTEWKILNNLKEKEQEKLDKARANATIESAEVFKMVNETRTEFEGAIASINAEMMDRSSEEINRTLDDAMKEMKDFWDSINSHSDTANTAEMGNILMKLVRGRQTELTDRFGGHVSAKIFANSNTSGTVSNVPLLNWMYQWDTSDSIYSRVKYSKLWNN